MRARLVLLLLTAGLVLPGAAGAQVMREFGAFAGTQSFGPRGPDAPGYGFNNLAGPMMFGGPQQPAFAGAWFGNGGGGGGMQPGYGWNADRQGAVGGPRFVGMRQAFGRGLDGASQTETAQATFLAMTQFTRALLDPAIDGRGAAPAELNAELAAYAAMGNDPTHGGIGREAYEAIYGKPSLEAPHWNVWAAGFGGSQVSTGGSASRSFGTVVGADYSLSPQTRMGFALAGGGTGFANNFSSGQSDLFQAGAFVRHTAGAAYVVSALAYGWQAITNGYAATPAGTDQFNAALNANAYSGRIEGGYRFGMPWLGITPYAAAEVTSFRLPGTAAQPANGFAAAAGSDSSFADSRTEFGLRTSTSLALFDGMVSLRGRLAWAHDFSAAQATPAAFRVFAGQGVIAGSTALALDSVLTGVSLELRATNGWFAVASFDSELSSLVRSYTGKAVLRYAW
ncbi:autotransporter outer membrane beta-barrel domain-containing protein [Bradyrhizobium sp. CB1650]|uniref:autotransporter outer membrane beta-barrel domain-containing protein n=1 Tax=Bradyrhizobium sp. CB1650 TaxID=3039153 RepID=UPI002434FDDB|nr:autotransporter outer membrane beta-barrel domain-containing protein [Bradyrhizobium sp. CB1650]WGD48614.1 autotransporter outer membrane beta-barrel domain-containing protein [Bradyrhizobium sp. CB1650]